MKAMILAAGRGTRMMPLTKNTPKPLLQINAKPLIQHTIEALVVAGVTELVINHAYLGEQIEACIGNGNWLGANVQYSRETTALETGGGILKALPLLGDEPFIIVNSDIWTQYPFKQLTSLKSFRLAHLVMVDNPPQHPIGDYLLSVKSGHTTGIISRKSLTQSEKIPPQQAQQSTDKNPTKRALTYSGISVLNPRLFNGCADGKFPLPRLFDKYMAEGKIYGEYYAGQWSDIGTPQRLRDIQRIVVQTNFTGNSPD
ncbi:MAG: nucleotidyltransferase family protein [Pseudomonadales bacterium]|nr:nucleotidyltransferase family protein [Pseudomonadales bacterium]